MSKRDEYIRKLKTQLDEMNAKIDEWEERADEAGGELKTKYRREIAELRAKSDAARSRLKELREAGDERWAALVEETNEMKAALSRSFNYLKSQL